MTTQAKLPDGIVHGLPTDLEHALHPVPGTLAAWEDITPLARNEWICWAASAKKPETRNKRINWGRENLEDGKAALAAGPDARTAKVAGLPKAEPR